MFVHYEVHRRTRWPSPIGPPTVVHNLSSTNQNKKVYFDNSSVMVIVITYLKIGDGIYWIHLLLTVYSVLSVIKFTM